MFSCYQFTHIFGQSQTVQQTGRVGPNNTDLLRLSK